MKKYTLRVLLITFFSITFFNFASAEKVNCDLLSPMQKKIYSAYCKSIAKNKANNENSVFKKGLGKLNTDSTLVDWWKKQSKKQK
jgi:hypothetical protein|tara:strand:+ start:545 stop:799 length:255 start_codon:yes stop_codon:yes gene_type:complete